MRCVSQCMPSIGEQPHITMSTATQGLPNGQENGIHGLPRTLSKEDIELAEHLVDHSQGIQNGMRVEPLQQQQQQQQQQAQNQQPHQSERVEMKPDPTRLSPTFNRDAYDANRQTTPSQTEQPQEQHNFSPIRGSSQEATPQGQICSNCGTTSTPLWRRSPEGATICNACGLYQKARNAARPATLKRPHASTTQNTSNENVGASSPRAGYTPTHYSTANATYVPADCAPGGSCPGGGNCNGTGGATGCGGCPAFNNRIAKAASVSVRQASSVPSGLETEIDVNALQQTPPVNGQAVATAVVVACQNCGTTVTPLWRRDEQGHTICNACGKTYYHRNFDNTQS
jgi:formylmethanofuran dehydrogenase subunit E